MINTKHLNERHRIIGELEVKFIYMPDQSFHVAIHKLDDPARIKGWEFPKSPISEALAFRWYEYVEREIRTHQAISHSSVAVPKFLQDISTNDAEELLMMVLEQLKPTPVKSIS